MPDIPLSLLALAALIIAAGVIVQSTAGMGFGMATAPLLAMIDMRLVPVPVIALGAMTATIAAWTNRRQIEKGEVGWALCGRLAGTVIAVAVLMLLPDQKSFKMLFSVAILAAIGLSLAGMRIDVSPRALLATGLLSGVMGTVSGVGAPPMGLIYQRVPPARARATLNAFFAFAAGLSLAALAAIGSVTTADLVLVALFVPVMLVAAGLAPRLTGIVDRRYRPVILGLSTIAAVNLLLEAVR